jgi:hypothetical protein
MWLHFRHVVIIGLCAAVALAGASQAEDYTSYTGTATGLKSHAFLYGERHVMVAREGRPALRVVLYTCRDGAPFARKLVSYVNPLAPNFTLVDASNGMREGVRTEAGRRTVFFRPVGGQEKVSALPNPPGLVADAGFDEFVHQNWRSLTGDQSLTLRFLVPSRLNDTDFLIRELRSDRVRGVPVEVFRLKLAGIVGWVGPNIDVYYDTRDHELVRYVGLSDLRDAAGENLKVDICFDPKDRKPAGPDAVQQAMRAPLAPCADT